MKRLLPNHKPFFVLLLALFAGLGTAYAYSFSAVCSTGQTLYYNITDATNHFVEITYPGTSSSSPWEGYTVPMGNISLPSSVSYNGTTYAVKGISEKAFFHCTLLTGELVIPSTVGSIGEDAFAHCSQLSGLTLPNSVNTIGSFAFYGCGFTGSLTIPSSVTEMGKQAFSDCSGITQVNYNSVYCNDLPDSFVPFYGVQGPLIIGQGVQRIPANIFTWTHFTGTLNIPNSVTSIGTNAFKGCTGFTGTLTLSNNLTTIGEGAFYGCTGLTGSLTLPSTLTTIGPYAFYDCAGLTGSLIIPNAVTEIGEYAFRDCTGFTGTLTLPSSLTSISNYAFYGCGFTGALVIPNGVTTIGNSAFIFCSGLSSLTLPASVTSLGPYVFFGCQGLTMITAHPTTPPTLGEYAFHNVPNSIPVYVPCSALEDYQAASGWSAFTNYQCLGYDFSAVCSTGQRLYYNITDATNHYVEITYPGTSSSSPWNGFTKPTGNITLPPTVTYNGVTYTVKAIGNHAFDHCSGLTGSLTIPNTVTSIGNFAFYYCNGFTGSLTLLSSLTTIGNYAFYCCTGFTGSLTIPNSVTSIGSNAFYYLNGLTGSLTIGNSVNTIGDMAFQFCRNLSGSLTIGSSVTAIGERAFQECYNVTSMTVLPETPPTLGNSVFYDVPTDIPVEVPCASLEDYQAAEGWSAFTNLQCREVLTYSINADGISVTVTGHIDGTAATGPIVIPETKTIDGVTYAVTAIGSAAFDGCSGLTGSLNLPNSLTSIGTSAFRNCSGLTGNLIIPNSVNTINGQAFMGCSGLTSLNLPNSLTSIGNGAFRNCSGLTGNLIIPNSMTTINAQVFMGCSGLTSLTLPASVTSLKILAFSGCEGLTTMAVFPQTPPSMGSNVFLNVPTDIMVYVPCSALEDYQAASGWSAFTNMQDTCDDPLIYAINDDEESVTVIGHIDGTAATGTLTIPETKTIDGVTYTVTAIGESAFEMCTQLTGSLTIPNSVTTIGYSAFRICFGFNGSLTLGSSVTNIGSYAFEGCSDFTSMTLLSETPPTLGTDVFSNVPSEIPVYVPCSALEDYQSASGWSVFTNIQCIPETLTVYDGTATNFQIPAYITYFDDFTRSQFVIPAADLAEMTGRPILSMTFYTTSSNVPYTTLSDADVYLMEVDYTSISAYEPKESATTVYSGRFSIVSADDGGGMMTIYFSTPYTYRGGNLLVGIENVEDNGFKYIVFVGQTVSGASISGHYGSSTGTIPANQQNFIPKTSFGYAPSMCAPKTLPYTCGFEEEDEFDCWTMLNCHPSTGRYSSSSYPTHQGDYGFCFYYHTHYNTHPPQYLISPELEGTTGVDVSFYYKNAVSLWLETFQVGYSTTTMLPDAFTWGDELTAQNNIWTYYENYFPEGTKYVAVKFNSIKFSSYGQLSLVLDDFSFIPAFCPLEDQCELTFTLTDSYGDGWNGASINVVDVETGIVLATMTNVTHDHANAPITETYTLTVCDGRELRFEWVSGNWDSECSYVVTTANGTEIFSGSGAMSEPVTYSVSCSLGQTIALTAGWNWFSLYVEAEDPVGMLQMLEESLGENGLMIKSTDIYTENDAEWGWFGDLDEEGIVNEQMYKILVSGPCTVNLEGTPANPANHPITINKGWNWIGFPNAEAISLDDAFDGFAQEGDLIRNSDGETPYDPEWGGWFGDFETLEPGQGYMYYSANNTPRTLIFPSGAK
jgi:hypothetical protein